MRPRRKPTSRTQKKAEQQLKRAVKRGDLPPPEPKPRKPKPGATVRSLENIPNIESTRKLQSAFVKLPKEYLEQTKALASNIPLVRPIPPNFAILPTFQDGVVPPETLTCPTRPKWRFEFSKKEVEANEEGLFKKWLTATDAAIETWRGGNPQTSDSVATEMPRSWPLFERNLDVWRQLWRVTEVSQIILVLLDSRCPLLHYPPSLRAYLSDSKVILVLTKVDLSGPERTGAWISYLQNNFPGTHIVQVESYTEKVSSAEQKTRKQYEPHLPMEFRRNLVGAIRDVHSQLLQPPERVKANETWLKKWKPPVKQVIHWEAVINAHGDKVGSEVLGTTMISASAKTEDLIKEDERPEPEFMTIGVLGQPNVGKSSLLNALFGASKVRASKTPGKTKHFQTLFWTHDLRLVDCPGLVMPNYVPTEMEVLSGILPISRMPAIPACIHWACQYLPLEHILGLSHPDRPLQPVEDKRTWRDGVVPTRQIEKTIRWTAMDVLVAYAELKGWVTAKAGRPDVNRAGNAILRALAEGRIPWAFWPPGTDLDKLRSDDGIWLRQPDTDRYHVECDDEGSADEYDVRGDRDDAGDSESNDFEGYSESIDEEDVSMPSVIEVGRSGVGRFDALSLYDDAKDIEDGDEEVLNNSDS